MLEEWQEHRISEHDIRLPSCEVRTVLHKIMHLLYAVWTLVSRKAAEHNQYRCALRELLDERH